MGLTSHLPYAYDAFSFYRISFSLVMSLIKMSLMTSLKMMVLGLVYLVCSLFYFLEFPLIVLLEYFQSEYFPAQKLF